MSFLIANFLAQLYTLPHSLHPPRLSRSYLDCHQIASDVIACQLPVTVTSGSLRICTELEDFAIIKPGTYDALQPHCWLEQCNSRSCFSDSAAALSCTHDLFSGYGITERYKRIIIYDLDEPNARCPILLLPVELTVLIFKEACFEPQSSHSSINTEVAISHVCYSWRSISLSCPQLWTSFKHDGRTLKTPIQQSRVDAYIKRSQDFSLDFSFDGDAFMDLLEVGRFALVPNASRLRRLALCISDSGEYTLAVLELFEFLSMDNLETFEIQLKGTDRLGDMMFKTFYFKGCTPHLKAFRTDSRLLHIFHTSQASALRNITDFQLDAADPPSLLSWSHFSSLSAALWTLTTLSISAIIFNSPTHLDLQTISLPNLRYLRCRDGAIGRFMSRFLHAPSLEELILYNLNIGWWADDFEETIPPINLFPRIKMVAFIDIICEVYHNRNAPLFALAQATCSATHIIISHSDAFNMQSRSGITRYLANLGEEPMLWRNLEVLSCFDKFMSKQMYVYYLDIMRYRSKFLGFKVGKLRIQERHVDDHRGSTRGVAGEEIIEAIQYGEDVLHSPNKNLFEISAEEVFSRYYIPVSVP